MLKFFRHLFDTKGLFHAIERSMEVFWRFALGGRRLDNVTDLVETVFGPTDLRMTFFVSAGAVHRHRTRIKRLHDLGHDIGSHGVYHSRMDMLPLDLQTKVLNESYRVLEDAGFGIRGFRPPYLNYNTDTRIALENGPFGWTSGEVIFWNDGFENGESIERLGPLYHFHQSDHKLSLPCERLGVLDIPVTAPDDEILYERYRLRSADSMQKAWCKIFEDIHRRGELFHVLFHPERFPQISRAIDGLVDYVQSRNPSVWMTRLDELARWWSLRRNWRWNRVSNGRVELQIPEEASVLASAVEPETEGLISDGLIYKDYRRVSTAENYPAWTVGLSDRCPKELEKFLHREGFLAEYSDQPEKHSLFIDRDGFSERNARALLEEVDSCEKPLLRVWRWPNGHQSAFCISADICAVDLRDFVERTLNF